MFSPIHHTFGPHIDASYMRRVLAMSYAPLRYRRGESVELLRQELAKKFLGEVNLFSSGRESLLALLKAMKLQSGEEVIVQGYTCVVVPNAIHAAGGTVIYADIDAETLNLSVSSVEPLVTSRTRAVICQHTFGIPSDVKGLRALCDRKKILLIEDCAHVLPDETGPKEIGSLGDALILSFGRDKAISGIAGGAVLVRDPTLASALNAIEKDAVDLPWRTVMTLLEYPARMRSIVRPLAWCGLQKPILAMLNRIGLFVPILTESEREGFMSLIVHRIPNACANLALFSLSRLKEINDHRRTLAECYLDFGSRFGWPMLSGAKGDLPLQKFPLFVRNANAKREVLKRENIHLDDGWTGCVICPDSVRLDATGYASGSDPIAESVSMHILSLPTHPTMSLSAAQTLAQRIHELLKADRKG